MHKIIFINQSSELYGSDKTLLDLVVGLKNNYNIEPIVIVQERGLLTEEFDKNNITSHFLPVLKLHKKMFSFNYLFQLAKDSFTSVRQLRKIAKKENVQVIYSNTFTVMLGILYALFYKTNHIWHCHEIMTSPKLFVKIYRFLLNTSLVDKVIYNSKTTMDGWVDGSTTIQKKSELVYNGIDLDILPTSTEEIIKLRTTLFPMVDNETVIYGNIGRISDRKGIEILIDAFYQVQQNNPNSRLLFVGSPTPGKEDFLEEMENKITKYKIEGKVKFVSFVKNVFPYWEAMDIAVIPSKEPEPFGLVAIEAMLVKKPVIAADHGGLSEIVIDHETGIKFEPNNLDKLVEAMTYLGKDKMLVKEYGNNGNKRVKDTFNVKWYVENIAKICQNYLK